MDTHHHDKVFMVTFAGVIGFLVAFTLAIMLIANLLGAPPEDPQAVAKIEDRLQPAGQVITDEAALMKVSAPAVKREPMTGEQVAAKVCAACHTTGVLAAPKTGVAADWASRKGVGIEGLLKSSIAGKGAMPARGGDPSLSDEELKAAIEVLLKGT